MRKIDMVVLMILFVTLGLCAQGIIALWCIFTGGWNIKKSLQRRKDFVSEIINVVLEQ